MKVRFALLLSLAIAALGVASSSALATTVSPTGPFTAHGSATLTAFIGTVTCDFTATGTGAADGTGSMNVSFANCVDSTGTACTAAITTGSASYAITGTGGVGATTDTYTVTSSPEAGTVGGASCATVCTVEITAANVLGGTLTDGDNPSLTLTGPVTSNDTANCGAGSLTAFGTITAAGTATGLTGLAGSTGNDIEVTA